MKALIINILLIFICVATIRAQANFDLAPVTKISTEELSQNFITPPGEAGITCYWWWLNGVATEESITSDLEQMKAKGYGSASIIDAGGFNQVTSKPTSGKAFLSPEWKRLYTHAVREADRLGLVLGINVTSGWNPGGPFVTPEYGLKKLTFSEVNVRGGGHIEIELPQPPTWHIFKDICVQAVPRGREGAPLKDAAIPSWSAKSFNSGLGFQEVFPLARLSSDFNYKSGADIIDRNQIINLTDHFDGKTLRWKAPQGDWTIIRYAWTCTAAHTSTTSDGWDGLAIDHLSPEAFALFSDNVIIPLIQTAKQAGNSLKFLLTDSWEMGVVNWTARFPEEFLRFRDYELWQYLPVMTGRVVESSEVSNRFLQDMRRTVSDCILHNHYKLFRDLAHKHGMMIDPEAGGPCYTPVDAMEVMAMCDIPHGEFWARSTSHMASEGARLSVRQSACVAHTNGKRFVEAEGPTSIVPHWERSPRDLKGLLDRVFCSGVNRIMWHTFTSSPKEYGSPGIEYFAGTHLNPNVTWWEQATDFVGYLSRCSYLLQQGLFVADVLYYTGDEVPNMVFFKEEVEELDAGYDWDKCSKDVILNRLNICDGRLILPDGMSYRVLALPKMEQIDLHVMRKIEQLVLDGMILIGDPPGRTTGLTHYPEGDRELDQIVNRMWRCNAGSWLDGHNRTENSYGKGRVIRGQDINNILAGMGAGPDFGYTSKDSNTRLDFIHRTTEKHDIYFITNRFAQHGVNDYYYRYTPVAYDRYESVECRFRVSGRRPEFWNPLTGQITPVLNYYCRNGYTYIPMNFAPEGSQFVIFSDTISDNHIIRVDRATTPLSAPQNSNYSIIEFDRQGADTYATITDPGRYTLYWADGGYANIESVDMPQSIVLEGPWQVNFDPKWGPVEPQKFDSLISWSESMDPEIRYFSGTATYRKHFILKAQHIKNRKLMLDLGNVQDLAIIRINGKSFSALWCSPFSIDISSCVKVGRNDLEIDVVNLWPNRLIGDGKLSAQERKTKSNVSKFDAKDAEKYLRKSGLLGPVKIDIFDRLKVKPSRK